jgi:hypothetical protein
MKTTMKTTMKKLTKLLFVLPLLLLCAVPAKAQGQGAVCQTTLSAAVPVCPLIQTTISAAVSVGAGGGLISGINLSTTPFQSFVTLASLTGVVAPIFGTPQTYIYIDTELMAVVGTPNTATLVVPVQRGIAGTQASPHASGTMALIGATFQFNQGGPGIGAGGNPSGACSSTGIQSTPYINISTGEQSVCSSLTGTWAPSWQNHLSNPTTWVQTATVASVAGTTVPSGPYFNISGTNAIVSFGIPVGFNATLTGGGCFTVKPTGVFTWTAAGNIQTAGTTTATTTPVTFCWDAAALKWVPSRLA